MREVERLQVFSLPLTRNSTAACLLILIVVLVLIQNEVVYIEAEIELLNKRPPNQSLEGYRPIINLLDRGREEESERFWQVRSLHHELAPLHEVGLLILRDKLQHLDPIVVDLLDCTFDQLIALYQIVELI